MATNNYQNLFQGASMQDVGQQMGQEREARIRQAMADNLRSGGNYYSSLIAKANAQQAEGFRGIASALGQKTGILNEDPRLAAARKRETDKNEIMGILGGYSDPNSPGGAEITEEEMKMGFSELMNRGYTAEAQQFLTMAQSMRTSANQTLTAEAARLKAINAGLPDGLELSREGENIKTVDGGIWAVDKSTRGKLIYNKIGGGGGNTFIAEGAQILKDGLTPLELTEQEYKLESARVWAKEKGKMREAVTSQGKSLTLAKRALELLKTIPKTGGMTKINDAITDFLGTTPADRGEFASATGEILINKIGEFGSNPTEGERAFLQGISAGLGRGKKVNEAILKQLIKMYGASTGRASRYLNMSFSEVNKAKSNEAKKMSDEAAKVLAEWNKEEVTKDAPKTTTKPNEADLKIGDVRTPPNGIPHKWNGTGWDPV